jgi:uncharacterized protein (TIGR03083 family)
MQERLDFDRHLARESARFAEALAGAQPDARVPTCPDWDADDLLWHLGKVQAFWARIVRERIADAAEAEAVEAERPTDRGGLFSYFDQASRDLQTVLAGSEDAAQAWTWSDDHTVAFIRRRQAHEALIHRVDAELTAGTRTPMDPALCADGVDEVLRVMYGGAPAWGTFTSDDDRTIQLAATDTDASWLVTLGRFTGIDPADDSAVDEADLRVLDQDTGNNSGRITGPAADLDCWLWHRPPLGPIERTGDPEALAAFASVVAHPIN